MLSGGERKRVAIAVEMVSDPSLIILDEPTAGLDSFKSTSICRLLNKLARERGKTVLATINSPSSEAFFYFDRLLLMADGHIMYQGEVKDAINHFSMIGRPVPKYKNPSDYFMRILATRYPKTEEDDKMLDELILHYETKLVASVKAENKLLQLK